MRIVFLGSGFRLVSLGRGVSGTMVLVKLLRAIRTFEFMAFAGNTRKSDRHEQQGKTFHRGAS